MLILLKLIYRFNTIPVKILAGILLISISWLKNLYGAFPRWSSGKESACQCKRHRFEPWSGKIPHTAEQLSLQATATQPVRCNCWSSHASSPWAHPTRKATMMTSSCKAMKSSPCAARPHAAKSKYQQIFKNLYRNRKELE